ncbi:NAD(P)H-dependent glycerol-3-phosphate dehydrogenase [Thermoleophilum album]|uniref:Glycerol-3-phosphate dehydrogenase n=1 Tax=Thermoleophilum album TaxID=29539 RepID=A0A1H6FHN2_THEAL|nr:NAD(P)H-dependent glycerol-3-phosphate dehydrogenase [Thermoleophilum album]SEH10336.1 glycerol-3-phosphate dehydrogenase (NAD(P)+) [Thermoleophilum album]
MVGGGSFGTAVAILLVRAGLRTTLLVRSAEHAEELRRRRENRRYLPGVPLPPALRVAALAGDWGEPLARADLVFLAVPSKALPTAVEALGQRKPPAHAGLVSLAKGLVPPDGRQPTALLADRFGGDRIACVGGPAHAREMVEAGAGLVCAAWSRELAHAVAGVFQAAGVVCEVSSDPVGVELAGVAKNAAAVAVGATREQGLNAAGMAAADIFLEVLAFAERRGAQARTFVGRAGTGDLVATALAPTSRNRTAGELLAQGVPAAEIPARVGQAVEALETVQLLAQAIAREGLEAPVTSALAHLIDGSLPLDRWVALVRAQQPPPARFGRPRSWLLRMRYLARRLRRRRQLADGQDATGAAPE